MKFYIYVQEVEFANRNFYGKHKERVCGYVRLMGCTM